MDMLFCPILFIGVGDWKFFARVDAMITWILLGVIAILLMIIADMITGSRWMVHDVYTMITHIRHNAESLNRLSLIFMEMSNNLAREAKPEEQHVIDWLREVHRTLQTIRSANLKMIDVVGEGSYKKFESRWHKYKS